MGKKAWLAASDEEYGKLKLSREIAPWEDGLRTGGERGSYEWWYFDGKLEDGSSLVIVFYTKPMASFKAGYEPHATFELTRPDGTCVKSRVEAPVNHCFYSRKHCNVKVGDCQFRGNLHKYEILWKDGDLEATVHLVGNVPSWRPRTGHILFGGKRYFAWLPSVPEGNVTVELRQGGEELTLRGTGYHDHNWGDIQMFFVMHHWYWGRAKIGPYQVVTSYITAAGKYGYDEIPVFMLAKDGEILADEAGQYLTYREENYYFDPDVKKHVAARLIYDYDNGKKRWRVTYDREGDLGKLDMTSQLSRLQYPLVWLMGLRGSYLRMQGKATLEFFEDGVLKETYTSPALWEQMYFGKDRC